jgi:hypothetical protein
MRIFGSLQKEALAYEVRQIAARLAAGGPRGEAARAMRGRRQG